MRPVTTGVPQGSIVSPLLFNIFINDIVMASQKLNFILYADDTTLKSIIDCFENGKEEIQISITTEPQSIIKWLDVKKLCLNMCLFICHIKFFHSCHLVLMESL